MTTTVHAAPPLPEPRLARTVRGSGPGLVLAHGAGGSVAANYGPVLDHLADGRTVVGVDYPGTGDSPRSDVPLSADELADQLVAAAVAEGLDTFALAGFSLGGPIAIRAARRHPERVTALVLTAAFAHADARLRRAASLWGKLYEAGNLVRLAEYLTLIAFSGPFLEAIPPGDLDQAVQALAGQIPPGTPEHTELVERIDVRGDLADLRVPALVIATAGDPLVSLDLQRQLADTIEGAQFTEIESGHLPFAERPEQWQELIATFVDTHRQDR